MQNSQVIQAAQGSQAIQGIQQGTQAATGIQQNMGVGSQAIQGMQDIHDIKPPVQVGIDPLILNIIIALIAVLLCLTAGYFLFRYIRKRLSQKKNSAVMLLPPPLPADQAALKELELIADLMMTEPRLYYFRLTALVKIFIGKVFNINAPEMTTQEIIAALNNLSIEKVIKDNDFNSVTAKNRTDNTQQFGIERAMIAQAKEFFISSSMVKYAGIMPQIDQMKSDENFVRTFIDSVINSVNNSLFDNKISNSDQK
ncbi:MAG: hypothetical protein HQK63_00870 [Desulfamplus sp.]|nr:hypothetical protein [Desulfamplus sp.]